MINIHHGDCAEVLRTLDTESISAIVTDPPAGISFMNAGWDSDKGGRDHWISWMAGIARECLRTIKPGGHALVWALPRTSHWTATAWEDAGWEVRDIITHLFGTGFPKSLDIAKGISKIMRADRVQVGSHDVPGFAKSNVEHGAQDRTGLSTPIYEYDMPELAKAWDGWGTALKPASENWLLLRKPLSERTVAANVIKWDVGGLNIAESRIPADESTRWRSTAEMGYHGGNLAASYQTGSDAGRYPANVILDGSDEVLEAFAAYHTHKAGNKKAQPASKGTSMFGIGEHEHNPAISGDEGGSPARFFYHAKAGKRDRCNSKHPTVKPVRLLEYLCRMICPKGGTILDPFAGSGSTGEAALTNGFSAILIEREAEYIADCHRRLAMWL